ncbi:MAG TPA: hypothetical protein VNT99_05160 [Methylomirabilota bacterium]|nr:hypothetical protein [Methylomirabilota bacterium]
MNSPLGARRSRVILVATFLALICGSPAARSCELCTIYNSENAARETGGGFVFSLSELFIPWRTEQLNGEEVRSPDPDHLDSSITHLVPTYNFGKDFGVSLSVPIIHRDFKRKSVIVGPGRLLQVVTEEGTETGLGDAALIGRWTAFRRSEMAWSAVFNILAGVKFPTGDTDPLREEAVQVRRYNALVGPGHVHDALGIPVSGVHARDVSLGSGSFDGVFGATLNFRYTRWFFNSQIQYYLRTEGESTYDYGSELMLSGGPGAYLVLRDNWTLSLQASGAYETAERDKLFGEKSDHTGITSWYLGPLVNLAVGKHFSANIGVDVPLRITNNGFQNVPDYRIHGGVGWRF